MIKPDQKGVIHLLIPILLLLGVIATVFLVTNGNPLKLFSRASNAPIVFQKTDGSALPLNSQGIPQATVFGFRIVLTSPFGPRPTTGGSASSPVSVGTVKFKVAESPTALDDSSPASDYYTHPQIIGQTLQNQAPGIKFIWVKFIASDGRTDVKSAQIEIVSPSTSGPISPTPSPSSTPTSSPTPSASVTRVFVTSTTYNGNLGGLAGADAKCQARASAANLGGIWKAWLSDSVTSAASRLNHSNNPYKRLDGKIVANNWVDLTDGNLVNPIRVNEYGVEKETSSNLQVWTNTKVDGSIIDTLNTCDNWTNSSTTTHVAKIGWSGANYSVWTNFQQIYCSSNNAGAGLYCFEQTSGTASPTPTPTPAPKPDLTIISIKVLNNRISNNKSSIGVTVKNAGNAQAGVNNLSIKITQTVNKRTTQSVCSISVPSISAGGKITLQVNRCPALTRGSYAILGTVDSTNIVSESNEGNNQLTITVVTK